MRNDAYKSLKYGTTTEKYLNMKLNFTMKRLIFQFRSETNYVFYKKASNLKGNRKNGFGNCELCGKETEDVYHVFCQCIHYKKHRNTLVNESGLNFHQMERIDFMVSTFTRLDENKVKQICKFWDNAMRTRDFICTY